MSRVNDSQGMLRLALRSNAAFSFVSGVALVGGAHWFGPWMGLSEPWWLRGIGLALIVFAAGLLQNAARPAVRRAEAWLAVGLDLGWVAATGAVLLTGWLNTQGNWTAAIVADIVLVFAVLQFIGLRVSRAKHS